MPLFNHIRRRRSASEDQGEGVRRALRNRRNIERMPECLLPERLISTGATMLNLACSDNPHGGYGMGRVVNIIGDSAAGKSVLNLTTFAECSYDERFDEYDFQYDESEKSLAFHIKKLFGKKTAKRIGKPYGSVDVEDFADNLSRTIDRGRPFIYSLDSFDGLGSRAEKKRLRTTTEKGSYKTEKVRALTELLRNSVPAIAELNAVLLIVSQTRDNLGFGAQFQPKIRAGGKALKFFSSHEMWLSVIKTLKKREVTIGGYTQARVTKNKLTGRKRFVDFPIYDEIGVDDIGSQIDFLTGNLFWKRKKNTIMGRGLGLKGTREKLIKLIENANLETTLREITGKHWMELQSKLSLGRKRRFCD